MEDLLSAIWRNFEKSKRIFGMVNLKDVFGEILKFDIDYENYSFIVKLITSKGIVVSYKTHQDKYYFKYCKVFSNYWYDHIYNLLHMNTVDSVEITEILEEHVGPEEPVASLELDDPRRSLEYVILKFYEIKNFFFGLPTTQLQNLFGKILKSEITDYHIFSFEITLTTEIGVLIVYRTDYDDSCGIYNFEPKNTLWSIHAKKLQYPNVFIDIKEMEISEVLLK